MESPNNNNMLNKLIFIICCFVIIFAGVNFLSCTFMFPGTIQKALISKADKDTPRINCDNSEKNGFDAMATLLTTVIALKTRMD